MARIPFQVLLCPMGIYRTKPVKALKAYATSQNSRWAAVQIHTNGGWALVHRRSGNEISSLLDRNIKKLDEILTAIKRIEAAHDLDLSAFDELPQVSMNTTQPIYFPHGRQPGPDVIAQLTRITRNLPDNAPVPTLFQKAA